MPSIRRYVLLPLTFALALLPALAVARPVPAKLFQDLSWRFIGPYRGGRVDAVAGVAGHPGLGYFGAVDGGVFKTTDAGVTWQPLFQHEPVASIGAIAVAPSNPNVIYLGTGESTIRSNASYGDGVWRSDNGGKSWHHVGLDDSRHIGALLVSPTNPDDVLVAALGHVWGPNKQRGVFLTTNGGKTWHKTLYVNDKTGAVDLARDPDHPNSVYATTWNAHRTPWFQYPPVSGPGSAIYHSSDGGKTWHKLAMKGLPRNMQRIGIAVAAHTPGPRLYAIVSTGQHGGADSAANGSGVYRSNDGGASWTLVNHESRISGRGWYFGQIAVDPANPDVVYVPNTSLYRSTDGGRHFTAIKGSPDGDDMQRLWIDPKNPNHMITSADQGTAVTLDDGAHWSSWFNQPTAQIYHISVDNRVPFHVYGTQQDSGALEIPSRAIDGIITNQDWHPVSGGESGYVFPRKGDPSIVYGATFGGVVTRFNTKTQMTQRISPKPIVPFGANPEDMRYYFPWNTAFALSPFDANTFYLGAQAVLETTDAGRHWKPISPYLTRKHKNAQCGSAPTRQTAAQCGYSVIYALALSPVKHGVIWAGTDDGRVWLTTDGGKQWHNVTPRGLKRLGEWSRVDTIEADPRDPSIAYIAVDRHESNDTAPYIFITRDYGRHWRKAVNGIPQGDYVHVVRADPKRKGLLYAGTEQGIFVSFDDGRQWQSLQLNLPTTSVRDLVVHDDDLVAATSGRGIWILDDIEPLREASAALAGQAVHLYKPAPAVRFRLSLYPAEARPPELPHAANPPTGAIVDYWLGAKPSEPVMLDVYTAGGKLVRHYSSADKPAKMPPGNFPDYWKSPPNILPASPGAHRFVWDMHYMPPTWPGAHWGRPPVLHRTPRGPQGPLVLPGHYRVVLTVDGKRYEEPLTIEPDPNAHASPAALKANFDLALAIEDTIDRNAQLLRNSRAAETHARKHGHTGRARQIAKVLKQYELGHLNGQLSGLMGQLSGNDSAPNATLAQRATQLRAKSEKAKEALSALLVPGL